MRALLIDAFDSFVYVIDQYLQQLDVDVTVLRVNEANAAAVRECAPDVLLLGPGPGHPADTPYVEILSEVSHTLPTLGVCLGHQAIGLAFGGHVARASHLVHGMTSQIAHDGEGVFTGMPNPFSATRYHSLIVDEATLPPQLLATAHSTDDRYLMGLRHSQFPIEGVQFHPESIATQDGIALFRNFLRKYADS